MGILSRSTASDADVQRHRFRYGTEGEPVPDSEIVEWSVNHIVERFRPMRIIIFGPARDGYFSPRHIDMVVIVRGGDLESIRDGIFMDLADALIDVNVSVVTPEMFERNRRLGYTNSCAAYREGTTVYAS